VGQGPADRSYGVAVAKLAGLPKVVLRRAEAVLAELEARREGGGPGEMPLFAAAKTAPPKTGPVDDPLRMALEGVNPDAVSAKEALDILYRLKSLGDAERR
jgi:DNA mismatch repair protein MutS